MAKSKKDLLANRQKVGRPSLRREVVTNEAQEAAVVQKVADNPPPVPPLGARGLTPTAPASAPTKKPRRTKAKATGSKKPATRAKKASSSAPAKKQPAPEEKEPFMRMTFDVPKSLHLRLKMHAIKNGVTIKAHMLRIIEESIDD